MSATTAEESQEQEPTVTGPTLQFGIPSLDELFGKPKYRAGGHGLGYGVDPHVCTSQCLAGPDGTGKSVLALHIASRYAVRAFRADQPPLIIYASTDLSHSKAKEMWESFGLHRPAARSVALQVDDAEAMGQLFDEEVTLNRCGPTASARPGVTPISEVIAAHTTGAVRQIAFLDLVSMTGGDDWSLLTDLLAMLQPPRSNSPLHLLVIDAVEGLQTLGGERDAYGETRTRRSRVEPIIRAAQDTAHVVFVLEEPATHHRFEEQFVTDAVVRLRTVDTRGYSARTVEIEKARGQTAVRGQHAFTIRNGSGSTTGMQENADDRRVLLPSSDGSAPSFLSYIQVFHSLDYLDSKLRASRTPLLTAREEIDCLFGIRYLDDLFSETGAAGVRGGSITSIVGDIGTHKSHLARGFLSQCTVEYLAAGADWVAGAGWRDRVSEYDAEYGRYVEHVKTVLPKDAGDDVERTEGLHALYRGLMHDLQEGLSGAAKLACEAAGGICKPAGVAVLITTDDLNVGQVAGKLVNWLREEDFGNGAETLRSLLKDPEQHKYLRRLVESRLVCRRLEAHAVAPALLMHIVRESVVAAKRILGECLPTPSIPNIFYFAPRIRIVIDDWDVIKRIYPAVAEDPRFLEALKRYLEREGVTCVITESRAFTHEHLLNDGGSSIGRLAASKLQTWHVPFNGRRIVAVSPVPSLKAQRSEVRELRLEKPRPGAPQASMDRLFVDPTLDLFAGLVTGDPHPIKLRVRLFNETPQSGLYIGQMQDLFAELYTSIQDDKPVVTGTQQPVPDNRQRRYNQLREFCYLQSGLLDHTVVAQVDDFWMTSAEAKGLSDQRDYLRAMTFPLTADEQEVADPYRLFQPTAGRQSGTSGGVGQEGKRRHSFFLGLPANAGELPIDRVPYTWDFGFLLCRYERWKRAQYMELRPDVKAKGRPIRVGDVWNALNPSLAFSGMGRGRPDCGSWRLFLEACKVVESHDPHGERRDGYFDLSALTGQSLVCLVLEVWASEIQRSSDDTPDGVSQTLRERLERVSGDRRFGDVSGEGGVSLIDWLGETDTPWHTDLGKQQGLNGFAFELYLALLLLFDALGVGQASVLPQAPVVEGRLPAVATRHWYKTACMEMESFDPDDALVPVRLPGSFCARGDWFLAIAEGSRSIRLGELAIDLLSSRRSNLLRLDLGVGLPTRNDIAATGNVDTALFTLSPFEWKADTGQQLPDAAAKAGVKRYRVVRQKPVSYGEFVSLGVESKHGPPLHWLWRSSFDQYDRHGLVMERWLTRVFRQWQQIREERGVDWQDAFTVYDQMRHSVTSLELETLHKFKEECEALVKQLMMASHQKRPSH